MPDVLTSTSLLVVLVGVAVFGAGLFLVHRGSLPSPPLWDVDVDCKSSLAVTWALLTGRPVRDPALAGLAVAEAAYQRRHWWVECAFVGSAVSILVVAVGAVSFLPIALGMSCAPFVLGALNAARAEAANRRLLLNA